MQTRGKRQAEGLAPLDAGAIGELLRPQRHSKPPPPPVEAALEDLWPLSARFPGPALEAVRSKLPSPTLAALRLVCRAARDDFVDGRCTKLRPLWHDAPLATLLSAAPRLRSLTSLFPPYFTIWNPAAAATGCDALTGLLRLLPGRGAALRELSVSGLCLTNYLGQQLSHHVLARLCAAIGRLSGLQSLEVSASGVWDGGALLDAAGALQALTRLKIAFVTMLPAWPPPRWLPPPSQLLRRLEALELHSHPVSPWLEALLEPGVAAGLTRLVDLSITFPYPAAPDPPLPPAPWRAPWLSQLTRLAIDGDAPMVRYVCAALAAPRALPALRALEATGSRLSAGELRALLAACDAAALEALTLGAVAADAVRDAVAAELPSLRSLVVFGANNGAGIAAGDWADAPFPPLTRLAVLVSRRLPADGPQPFLAPLFASDWARGLRDVELHNLGDSPGPSKSRYALFLLQGLSALTALRRLSLEAASMENPAPLIQAARKGWADGWAPRLAEFRLRATAGIRSLRALGRLPFHNLERMELSIHGRPKVTAAQFESFSTACAAAMPRLTALEFSCS